MPSARLNTYVPLIRHFAANLIAFHSVVAQRLCLHVTDLKGLRILERGPMTAGELGEEAGLSGAAVTALIDRLEKAGYVFRERGTGDRRRVTIHVIAEKMTQVDRHYEGQRVSMSKLLSQYSAKEFSAIADFLEQTTRVLANEAKKLEMNQD